MKPQGATVTAAPPDWSTEARSFETLRDGGYRLSVPSLATAITVDHLRRDHHQLYGALSVECRLPGVSSYDGVILSGAAFNLSSLTARATLVRRLEQVGGNGTADLPWNGWVEELCTRADAAERIGSPSVDLAIVAGRSPEAAVTIDGWTLPLHDPSILFGAGGTGKSFLALHVAGTLATRAVPVLYTDWETDQARQHDRLVALFGGRPPSVEYLRCDRPLTAELDRIRRVIRARDIQYAVLDSAGYATDGAPESAESALGYARAVRQLGVGTLALAHVAKSGDTSDRYPFGSIFYSNSARVTWYAQRAAEESSSQIVVGLYARKHNDDGPPSRALGFRLTFAPGRVVVAPTNLADEPSLTAQLSVTERVRYLLRRGAQSREALAEELADVQAEALRQAIFRGLKHGRLIRFPGQDGVELIGLTEGRHDEA